MGALGAIFFFMILLLCCGLHGIIAGVIGLIVFGKMKKRGSKAGKPLTIVSTVILAISVVATMIPVGFGTFIVAVNATPPEGYVETEIVIKQNGHQDTRFTADGVVYEVVEEFTPTFDWENETPKAVFSYKEEGFMNRNQWGNYYALENEQNFSLVFDNYGNVFCAKEEMDEVLQYYEDENNLVWYYEDFRFEGEKEEMINRIHWNRLGLERGKNVPITYEEEVESFTISAYNKEGNMRVASFELLYYENLFYYVYRSEPYENGIEYGLCEVWFYDMTFLLEK